MKWQAEGGREEVRKPVMVEEIHGGCGQARLALVLLWFFTPDGEMVAQGILSPYRPGSSECLHHVLCYTSLWLTFHP